MSSLFLDNAKETLALESKCEELRAQIEYLTKQKEDAFEEIERLKDQVKFFYLYRQMLLFPLILLLATFVISLMCFHARVFCL